MRILIIVVLLILTPLRGWAADSMAVQMATQTLGGPTQVRAATAETPIHCAGMADHSPDVTPQAADGEATDSDSHGSPCGNCAACQMCATVALFALPMAHATSPQAHHLPWAALSAFSNADLAPGQKPPIS